MLWEFNEYIALRFSVTKYAFFKQISLIEIKRYEL